MKLVIKNQNGETKTVEIVSVLPVKDFGLLFFTMYIENQKIGRIMLNDDKEVKIVPHKIHGETNLELVDELNEWLKENFKVVLGDDISIDVDIHFLYTHIYHYFHSNEKINNYQNIDKFDL